MKKNALSLVALFLLIFTGCSENPETEIPEQTKNELRQNAQEFMESLKTVLVKEMQTNGIKSAVSVCADTAQVMTADFGVDREIYIKRVSFRNRNPLNVPDEYEAEALHYFEDLKGSGSLNETTEYFTVTEEGESETVIYLRPIILQAPCLNCHGDAEMISPEVKQVLNSNYPDDKATGYQVGDLRGAVSVRKTM